jgi:hypothetical protein
MASRLFASVVLAFWQVACACNTPGPGSACDTTADCRAGQTCVDGRCRARLDGGGEDAGPARDAPAGDVVCAAAEAAARELRRPIDAIVLPDESGTMGPARDSVALAMDTTFRIRMEAATIDYRVVWNGTWPLPNLEASGRLTRNPVLLGSGEEYMFRPVLDTYDVWRPSLRDEAIKVFIHFTDATSSDGSRIGGYTGMFDEVLVTREPAVWGTAGAYRFSYHAFIGMSPNDPIDDPYEPADPVVVGGCDPAFQSSAALEEMARRTGGLRYPLCYFDRFDAVFRRIADTAIDRAAIACEIGLPDPPAGMTLDLSTLAVRYRDGTGGETIFLRVASAADCAPDRFYLETDRVVLCSDSCARVEADPGAMLSVLTGCDPTLY